MLFCSAVFLFLFLPVTALGYFWLNRRNITAGRVFLLLASLFFYGYFNPFYLYLLVFSIGFNYLLGRQLLRSPRKIWLWCGIAVNLLFLGYYKYFDFFLENVNAVLGTAIPLKHLLLPLGISFFTFQQIAYLYDIYKGKQQKRDSFLIYALYVTFFPQLIAGPIVLAEEMIPQFEDAGNARFNPRNFANGIFVFALGLAKKLVLADYFATVVSATFGLAEPCFLSSWTGALAYTLQIYFDFSGYSDMAIGLGLMFNVVLPINFNSPLRAGSIKEFWQKWHITLGRFLSTFVYRPLGGSRCSTARTSLNLFITFVVCGFWHGASWIYIVYGALQGAAMIAHHLWRKVWHRQMPRVCGVVLTTLFAIVTLTLFQCADFTTAHRIFGGMIGNFGWNAGFDYSGNVLGMLLVGFGICYFLPPASGFRDKFRPTAVTAVATAVLLIASVFCMNRISPFIYFNF